MDAIIPLVFYALIGILIATLLVSIFQQIGLQNKRKALMNIVVDDDIDDMEKSIKITKKKIPWNPYIRLKDALDKMFYFESNDNRKNLIFGGIIAAEMISFLGLILMQKYFVAILFVIIIHLIALKLIRIKTVQISDYVQSDLPSSIKHVVKVLTKTNDLKTVFLDASKGMKEPLRSRFVEMSRLMTSNSHENALMKFADETQSIWSYTFAFIMNSYSDSSKKSEIIRNLTLLGEMMEAENQLAERRVTERKPMIILNNVLLILGLLTFLANLWKNDYSFTFFFETPGGVMSLILGFTCLGLTLIVNFMVGKKRY